jgi:hypothetical protein
MENPYTAPTTTSERKPLTDFDRRVLKTYLAMRDAKLTRWGYFRAKRRIFVLLLFYGTIMTLALCFSRDEAFRIAMALLLGAMISSFAMLALVAMNYPRTHRLQGLFVRYDVIEDLLENGEPMPAATGPSQKPG